MAKSTTNRVGAYYAKTHFSELLEHVASGEEITVTRHGAPIARLVPVDRTVSEDDRRIAVADMRMLAGRNRLAGLSVKSLMAEGRR